MEGASPLQLCKQLEGQLKRLLAALDMDEVPQEARETVVSIRRLMADARLDTRDYEYAETGDEQRLHAANAVQRLDQVRKSVLLASEYNVFSAIDVAHITAVIEQISKQLT